MKRILPLILLLIPCLAVSNDLLLKADADKVQLSDFKDTYVIGNLKGELKLLTFSKNSTLPPRVVIGVSDDNPKQHAFQIVFERIANTDEYWLAYEYIRDGVTQIRVDIQSGIKLNEPIPFDIFWQKTGRLQVAVFSTAHFPYTNLKIKKPFILINSGTAELNYDYNEVYWTDGAPH